MRFFHDDADRTRRTLGSSVGRCKLCAAIGVTAALLILGVVIFLVMRYVNY